MIYMVDQQRIRWCIWFSLVCSSPVEASFTDDLAIGNAKALALGHAVTADPPGIDSIHFNPAGLARLKARQFLVKFVAGDFSATTYFGEYGDYQQKILDDAAQFFLDADGNLSEEGKLFLYDEAYGQKSETAGPTVMTPGKGMQDKSSAFGATGGASYNAPDSLFTFATSVYTPMMMGAHKEDDDPGRFFQQRSAFALLTYFSPSVGYEFSDTLSIGMAINLSYAGMGLEMPVRAPNDGLFLIPTPYVSGLLCNENGEPQFAELDLCTSIPPYTQITTLKFEASQNDAIGFNLGLLWSPKSWFTLGLSYNSGVKVKLDGEYDFPVNPPFEAFLVTFMGGEVWNTVVQATDALGFRLPSQAELLAQGSGEIKISYEIPQRFNAGISLNLTPKWSYNFDIKWTEWSTFSDISLQFDKDIPLLALGNLVDTVGTGGAKGIKPNAVIYRLGLRDVAYWSMGTEYKATNNFSFRAGLQYRPSAVRNDSPNATVTLSEGYLYSLGGSYLFRNKSQIDFTFGYLQSEQFYPACTAVGNDCDPVDVTYAPFQGEDIQTEVTFLLFELSYSKYF
ncbi:hypothetical protein FT643_01505 [Ketobacter sp. MCCC 1A13808]|nr:hypothetical protein [Ketobacter sp. MCCC 1A13808]